ncbi:PHOSPHATE TRANSPORTER [Salix purpurea]|uniref:PHOSPHATE TRANSPORTER n=1 Tax=Salix purpurea TaxID=77065 RepID=A0A9Q0WVD3_SALPP|nr:PHOSPHATE TRANSPORTER [Salix purpurea]
MRLMWRKHSGITSLQSLLLAWGSSPMPMISSAYPLSPNCLAAYITTSMEQGKPGSLPPNVAAVVNGVAFCGTLSGQLFFGWLGDKMGRKRVYGMTLMLMVICSIGSGLSFSRDAKTVISTLCFFRFWLGFGIGGDYPLSATIMSEYANKKTRGAFIAAVFAMQGFGILAGGIFAIIVSSAFKARFDAPAYKVECTCLNCPTS